MNLKVFYKLTYGLYVIGANESEKLNGQISNTVFQITSEPPQIAICINKQNLTHQLIQESKFFTVSILKKDTPMKFIGNFGFNSGRNVDKFKDVNYKIGITGTPIILDNCIGYLEAEVINMVDVGSHSLFIGKVVAGEIINDEEPLTYAYYHEIKGGKSPKTAPNYIPKNEKEETQKMEKYRCRICGYIYDPEKGDPENGIAPGTSFEELPDNWVCPVCGSPKEEFEQI